MCANQTEDQNDDREEKQRPQLAATLLLSRQLRLLL